MSDHRPDLLDMLVRARPSDPDLDRTWAAEHQDELWRRIQRQAPPTAARPRSRTRVAWLAAAVTVSAVAVIPVVVSGGDAAARAELMRLAVVAAEVDGSAITPGGFLHVRAESTQRNSSLFGDGQTYDNVSEQWTRWDGATWVVVERPSAGWTERAFYPAPEQPSFGTPTPEFVADLPDEASALRAFLDETVSGSNSHDEAIFVAISDLVVSRLLDPATFAVALEVLADVDGVETRDVVVDGRDAVAVSHDRFLIGRLGRKTIIVDQTTGQLLGTESVDPGGTSSSRATLVESTDSVPAEIRADLRRYGNGSRVCADGAEADGDGRCA